MTTDKKNIDKALKERWYYTVELREKEYTNGFSFKNIAASRKVLDSVTVKSKKVLDISTMEGMFSTLMTRRGASVLATDAINLSDKINIIKDTYNVNYEYRPNFPVTNFVENIFQLQTSRSLSAAAPLKCEKNTPFGFDVILSSGLIYHVMNPIDHIINYRRLCKEDGLLIIETACLFSDNIEIVHDWHDGVQTFGGNATWFISTRALEIYLRACFFEPLGFVYLRSKGKSKLNVGRIAVVARATKERSFTSNHLDIIKGSELYKNYDYAPLYPAAQLTGKSAVPPTVDMSQLHSASDLRGSIVTSLSELQYSEDDLKLKLSDS